MATTSFMVANPVGLKMGTPGILSSLATTSISGAIDDAQITESDPEETLTKALIGGAVMRATYVQGEVILTFTVAEVEPTTTSELTGYTYTAPTASTIGSFARPTYVPTITKMIVVEFEGGIKLILHKAQVRSKIADMDVATGICSHQITCTAQVFEEDQKRYGVSFELPMTA